MFSQRTFLVVFTAVVAIIVLGGAWWYLFHVPQIIHPSSTLSISPSQVQVISPTREQGTIKDCGASLACFIASSQTCSPKAKVMYTATLDLFGVQETSTTYYEIRGLQNGKCVLYMQQKNITLAFPSSVPQAVIDQQRTAYQSLIGKEETCLFKTQDLYSLLVAWQRGNRSTDDFSKGQCSGSLFP